MKAKNKRSTVQRDMGKGAGPICTEEVYQDDQVEDAALARLLQWEGGARVQRTRSICPLFKALLTMSTLMQSRTSFLHVKAVGW